METAVGLEIAKWILTILVGYFLGNISFGVILSNLIAKQDVRSQGSGSTGTTNMFRMLGMKASLMTLVGDLIKALLASLVGRLLLGDLGSLAGGLMAVAGHNWPIIYRFKGGKGIAATAGAILGNQPLFAIILLPLALVSIRLIGIVSIVSLGAVSVYTIGIFITHFALGWYEWPTLIFAVLLLFMAFFSHRSNIKRLMDGTEKNNRLDFSKGKQKGG